MSALAIPIRGRLARRRGMRGADDEFVASYVIDPDPGGGGTGGEADSGTTAGSPGIVTIPELRQQYEQGDFSSAPAVPGQYSAAYNPQSPYESLLLNANPDVYVVPSGGPGAVAGQENLAMAFRDPGSPGGVRAVSASTAATTTATQSSGLLSTATGFLGQPVTAAMPWLTWGWALLIGLGLIVVMRKS